MQNNIEFEARQLLRKQDNNPMQITVDKTQLLTTLQDNRETHARIFQIAIEKYREQAIEQFTASIDKIKAGGDVDRYMVLPVPEEHTDDFDRAIAMVEWHQGDTMELTEVMFQQYVRNEWAWHKNFLANTASYAGAAG